MTIPAKHRITIRRSILVAVALLMSASLGAPAAQAAQTKRCGTVMHDGGESFFTRYYGIKASGVSCARARKLTGQWITNQRAHCKFKFCRVRDFTCRAARPSRSGDPLVGSGDPLVDCRRPGARVTWHLS